MLAVEFVDTLETSFSSGRAMVNGRLDERVNNSRPRPSSQVSRNHEQLTQEQYVLVELRVLMVLHCWCFARSVVATGATSALTTSTGYLAPWMPMWYVCVLGVIVTVIYKSLTHAHAGYFLFSYYP